MVKGFSITHSNCSMNNWCYSKGINTSPLFSFQKILWYQIQLTQETGAQEGDSGFLDHSLGFFFYYLKIGCCFLEPLLLPKEAPSVL